MHGSFLISKEMKMKNYVFSNRYQFTVRKALGGGSGCFFIQQWK
jgi:hypothetical protein